MPAPGDLAVSDLDTARAVIATLQEQLARSQRDNAALRHQLDVLCRRLFGKRSEKVDPSQLRLALEQLANESGPPSEPVEMDSDESPVRGHTRRASTGRRPFPRDLPREVTHIDLPEADKVCGCGGTKVPIGAATSEKLEYVPASFFIRETARLKYACPACHAGVTEAPAPPQAVEKSLAGAGLLAHVVVSKYADHLPLHRLEGMFARHGVHLARSTLCGWVADVAAALAPIGDQLRREILATDYIQTDDTPVTILQDRGGSLKGRLWTYLDPLGRQVVFDATATHAREGPAAVLAPFTGWLQADAYAGYDAHYRTGWIVEVGCWAHARRRFVEALDTDPSAALIVALIQRLYQGEREAADTPSAERQARRQAQSVPILAQIDEARQRLAATTLPKAPLGDALRYLGNQWGALQRYVDDGRLCIDNNNAERELRAVGIGRKNWLFAGSLAGAERAALLYSLVQSCRLRGVPPFLYLRDVLLRVATHPQTQIAQLTPRGWAETFGPPRA